MGHFQLNRICRGAIAVCELAETLEVAMIESFSADQFQPFARCFKNVGSSARFGIRICRTATLS